MAQGLELPGGVHAHIAGIGPGAGRRKRTFMSLEDNVRTPSGRLLRAGEPRGHDCGWRPSCSRPCVCCRSPTTPRSFLATLRFGVVQRRRRTQRRAADAGPFSTRPISSTPSLADEMGIELVEGLRPVRRRGPRLHGGTPRGPQRVDVIYRRVDDAYLDPLAMRPDSYLGVAGLPGRVCAPAGSIS